MSSPGPDRDALVLAEQAYALVQVSPRRAMVVAERALVLARSAADPTGEVAALHALAWAQFQLGDARSLATVKRGIRIAEEQGNHRSAGLLRRRLAYAHAVAGRSRAAQREIKAAIALLEEPDRAQSEIFRLAIHRRAPAAAPEAHREVLRAATRALRVFRRRGDEIWEARLLVNRGILHTDRGELDAAEADVDRAHVLFARLGAEAAAADAMGLIAELARLRGDLIACLEILDTAESALPPGETSYDLLDYRTTALVEARLLPEARAAAQSYVDLCLRTGLGDEATRFTLIMSTIASMSGDAASARRFATNAARSFAARRQPMNAALARAAGVRARLVEGSLHRSSLRSCLDAATVLECGGWRQDALRTRLLAARVALAVGSRPTARRELDQARSLGSSGTAVDRVELSHARALLRLADGDHSGAERELASGLRQVDEYRAAFGAAELRATASRIGFELARDGLRIALASGNPAKILVWSERLRSNALQLPAVRPSGDPRLRRLQSDLRRVTARAQGADASGTRLPRAGARQAELESAIRARSRLVHGERAGRIAVLDLSEASHALGDRVLVEYVELDGGLTAITLAQGRLAVHDLGPNEAPAELEWLRFALARLARGRAPAAERDAAVGNARHAATSLDRLLIGPLISVVGDSPLVVVPTGPLHAVPWGSLPSLNGRPLVVSPSLSVWLDLTGRPRLHRRRTVLVSGPRLRHSAREVTAIAGLLPDSTVLRGRAATITSALAALDGAGLAHLACHGRFRADSPLFSSLEMADGPLNVYELQNLPRVPEVFVLSACDLAISDLHPGDELLGFAAALLGMGTRTIVASVVPVPDAAVSRLMLAFHRYVAAGQGPASALATAQAETGGAAAGFVCLGSG